MLVGADWTARPQGPQPEAGRDGFLEEGNQPLPTSYVNSPESGEKRRWKLVLDNFCTLGGPWIY